MDDRETERATLLNLSPWCSCCMRAIRIEHCEIRHLPYRVSVLVVLCPRCDRGTPLSDDDVRRLQGA